MVDHVFPQNNDNDDAANFGQHLGRDNISDYVEEGMGFTVDYGVPELTVGAGKAYILTSAQTAVSTQETRSYGVDYNVEMSSKTVSLTDNDVNYVYLEADPSNDDSPGITVNTTGIAPNDASILIGEVDTGSDTYLEHNREPDAAFESLTATDLPHLEEYHVEPSENIEGIQRVIDNHAPNVLIRLGEGTYIGSELTLDHGVHLVGSGRNASIIKLEDGANTDLVVTPDVDNRNAMMCRFQDISFDGNKANNSSGHVVYGAFWNGRFIDCDFEDAPQFNFWLAGSSGSTDDNFFRGCRIVRAGEKGARCGTNKVSSPAVGVVRFDECLFGANDGTALQTRGNSYVVDSCKFYSNASVSDGSTIEVDRSNFVNIVDCDIATQDNQTNLVTVVARNGVDVNTVHIKNNWFRNSYGKAISAYADGNDIIDLQVTGNSFISDDGAIDGFDAFGASTFIKSTFKDNTFHNAHSGALVSAPSGVEVRSNRGYTTENSGTVSFSGDDLATTFDIPHGLESTPNSVSITPKSEDAIADHYVTADATNITINYDAAPPSGSDNLVFWWEAEV